MKRKILFLGVIFIILILITAPFCLWLSMLMLAAAILTMSSMFTFWVLNKLYKKTNHWKNNFLFTENFISNSGYRDNLNRNFDIANLGSNPALFGFFYEKVKGQNWATGSQGLEMDFEILKYNHSYLKEGGYVLIPIMPFTSISQYIKTKNEYWSPMYYLKFSSILDYAQTCVLPYGKMLLKLNQYPLLYYPRNVLYIIRDVELNKGLTITEQQLDYSKLKQDATVWINEWEKEFDVKSMDGFFDDKFADYKNEAVNILQKMISFCLERGYNPILITVPMSKHLAEKFNDEFKHKLIIDFVNEANTSKIPFLDYMFNEEFGDDSLYINSFFLNLKGRKLFTNKVLTDIGLIK